MPGMQKLLVRGARQLVTMHGPPEPRRREAMRRLEIIPNGAVLIVDGVIQDVGPGHRVENLAAVRDAEEFSADGRVVMPGFVDAHTQAVSGPPLLDMYECGGGDPGAADHGVEQYSTHRMELEARKALRQFVRHGTTTIESKTSGIADRRTDVKMLRALAKLRGGPLTIRSALCWNEDRSEERLRTLVMEVLPHVRQRRLAHFAEAYCRQGATELARHYLSKAAEMGLATKVFCEGPGSGGVSLALELGAVAVGCLSGLSDNEIHLLGGAWMVAVLLPGVAFHHRLGRQPPASRYSPDMSKHYSLGTDSRLKGHNQAFAKHL